MSNIIVLCIIAETILPLSVLYLIIVYFRPNIHRPHQTTPQVEV